MSIKAHHPYHHTVIFARPSQFAGLRVEVMRKEKHLLLKFMFSDYLGLPGEEEIMRKEQAQAAGLLQRLATNPSFTLLEADSVSDQDVAAPDITAQDAQEAIFIAPATGKTTQTAYVELMRQLEKLHNPNKERSGTPPSGGNSGR